MFLDKKLATIHTLSMLLAHVEYPETYTHVLIHPIWKKIITWLQTEALSLADGDYEIEGRKLYATITTTRLMPREETIFEAHKNYIDLHYCLEGGEVIEWAPVDTLTPKTEYDAEKDYTLFESPAASSICRLTPGTFAIFFLADAHMPKVHDGHTTHVRKVVIKIDLTYFT